MGVGVFLVTTCNPFLEKKRCFHTRARGLFSFRQDQPFGGSWGWSGGVSLGRSLVPSWAVLLLLLRVCGTTPETRSKLAREKKNKKGI